MEAQAALTIMKEGHKLAKYMTIEHAESFIAVAKERGLTPFQEIWMIFTEKREKRGSEWVTAGIKSVSFKEHYSVQARWAQQAGGYSVPKRETQHNVTRPHPTYKNRDGSPQMVQGVEVTVGIVTNRDYAALMQMATARIPGWNFTEERENFTHYATAFVPNKHRPPSGWSLEDVARKRAEEMALRKTFGKEPSQARQVYAALSVEDRQSAAAALYGSPEPQRPVLESPQVVDAEIVTDPVPALKAQADAENAAAALVDQVDVPDGLPSKWGPFCKAVKDALGFDNCPHVEASLRQVYGEDFTPFHTSGKLAGSLTKPPAELWAVLVKHQESKQ